MLKLATAVSFIIHTQVDRFTQKHFYTFSSLLFYIFFSQNGDVPMSVQLPAAVQLLTLLTHFYP